jgi:hypothetical protein
MILMRTGELVDSIAQLEIKGIKCQELKVVDSGHSNIPKDTIYMLMDSEIERNKLQ